MGDANGKVLAQCRPHHRHQEYLSFLREIEKNVPKNLEVHIIVDTLFYGRVSPDVLQQILF